MILLVNGPNLNLLGEREPEVYGHTTLRDIEHLVTEACAAYGREVKAFQSNHEGALVDFIHEHRHAARGLIINPGAFPHTSYTLHDCLKALSFPVVEVHISNVHAREEWRRTDLLAPATRGQIVGLGPSGYYYAAVWLCSQAADPVTGEYDEDGGPVEVGPDDVAAEETPPPLIGGDYEG